MSGPPLPSWAGLAKGVSMAVRIWRRLGVMLLACSGCASLPAQETGGSAAPPAAVTMLARTGTTVTGQRLGPIESPWEAIFSRAQLPPGGALPMHKHPWPRYAYVVSGRLRVSYEEARLVREFGPGEAVVEAVGQWHEARVVGNEPVILFVFDQVPPGQTNVVTR
jgi:quercetin dioxygenase-like cupin family protein